MVISTSYERSNSPQTWASSLPISESLYAPENKEKWPKSKRRACLAWSTEHLNKTMQANIDVQPKQTTLLTQQASSLSVAFEGHRLSPIQPEPSACYPPPPTSFISSAPYIGLPRIARQFVVRTSK